MMTIFNNNLMKTTFFKNSKVSSVGFISMKGMILWVRLTCWLLRTDPARPLLLCHRIQTLWKKSGNLFTVTYLKECVRLIQHYVGGSIIQSSEGCIVGITGGLPRIIPGPLRLLVRQRDPESIRLVLTLFSVYRIMKCPGILKLSSITDPFSGCYETLPKPELQEVFKTLMVDHLKSIKRVFTTPMKLYKTGSSGPNYSSSLLGLGYDLAAWEQSPLLLEKLKRFCHLQFGDSFIAELFPDKGKTYWSEKVSKDLYLGRLALKEEGAGKVRVFAITDVITQSVMLPLHDWIFSLLKQLPMDGTFDQGKPLQRLISLQESEEITGKLYSYDLSSATDRLPIALQRDVLSLWWGDEFSDLWRDLMTERDWVLKLNKSSEPYITSDTVVRYSVGQPMGALSSWGMLALTHHVIVRTAARRVGFPNFTYYALLGDDIVIANSLVAKAYLQIMMDLGVEINLSKTLQSEDTFEFAKRLIRRGVDCSPVGPKNLLLATKTPKGLVSLFIDVINKGSIEFTESAVREMYKKIPGVSSKKLKDLVYHIIGPLNLVHSSHGLSSEFSLDSSQSEKGAVILQAIGHSVRDFLEERQLLVYNKLRRAISDFTNWNLEGVSEDCNTYFREVLLPPLIEELEEELQKASKYRPTDPFAPGLGDILISYEPIYLSRYISKITRRTLLEGDVPPFNPFEPERVVLPFNLINVQARIFNDNRLTGNRFYTGLRPDLYKSPRTNRFF